MKLENCFVWDTEDHVQIAEDANEKLINDKRFNWKKYSGVIAEHCPEHFDKDKFKWGTASWAIVMYQPQLLDENFNCKNHSQAVAEHCPHLLALKPKDIK